MKTCTKCGEEKSLDQFYKRFDRSPSYRSACKTCTNSQVDYKKQYSNNKEYYVYKAIKRKAHVKRATPSWANQEQIRRTYAACAKITEKTGIQHHVDHVIPLQGANVCGLHVPNNLAIIPAKMNLQKSNKY